MLYDFHTHTSLSDGELSPIELIRRAEVAGYTAVALTDHAGPGTMERIIRETVETCNFVRKHWKILAVPGVELTHVPAKAVSAAARRAKELGAVVVVVHGETLVEPVEKGTNLAAVKSPFVDILAHPGLITPQEAKLAAKNGVYLEISARKGHSLANGRVAGLALAAGAQLLLDSDAHSPSDLLSESFARTVLLGAGLDEAVCNTTLLDNPQALLKKLAAR